MKKHYLITGGAGFIGSHIAKSLLEQGHSITILDDFSTGRKENIPSGAKVIEASILDENTLREACKGVDGIFHTAAISSVPLSIEQPLKTHEVNLSGTLRVFFAACKAKVKRVVFCSSAAVYGDQKILPLREDMPAQPLSPYGLHKYAGEQYARMTKDFWEVETVCLRYFNVYGPGMSLAGAYASVMAIFLSQKKSGQPLSITGSGDQTRDFVYIDDVVEATITAMESSSVGKGEVINIGSGTSASVNEIAKIFGGPVIHIPQRHEIKQSLADRSQAKKMLGWEPKVTLKEGIERLKNSL